MIDISNLKFGYGERTILNEINLHFEAGSMCAIMGANGCGKTTLLRCIANLIPPQQGTIQIEGKGVKEYSAKELAQRLSFVRQHAQTDFEFSAFETVLMGRNPYQRRLQNESEKDWKIVEECMKQTHTWHLRLSLPSEMSGGELQRVMIARALTQQTPIILLDEPTSNLDISHQFEIMQLLKEINEKEGKTILIVVHDMNLAYRYCKDLLLLHQGKVFYHGKMNEGLTPERIKTVFGVDSRIEDSHILFD